MITNCAKRCFAFFLFLLCCTASAESWNRFDLSKLPYFNDVKILIKHPSGWEFQRNHRRQSIIQFISPLKNNGVEAILFAREKHTEIINKNTYTEVANKYAKFLKTSAYNIQYTEIEGQHAVIFDVQLETPRAGLIMHQIIRFMIFSYKKNFIVTAYSSCSLDKDIAIDNFNPRMAFLYFNSINIIN